MADNFDLEFTPREPTADMKVETEALDLARSVGMDVSQYAPESADDRISYRTVKPEDYETTWNDYGRALAQGGASVISGLGGAAEYLTSGAIGGGTRKYFGDIAEEQVAKMSPSGRRALTAEFLPDEGGTGVLENFSGSLGLKTIASLPSLVAAIIPGGIAGSVMRSVGASLGTSAVVGGVTGRASAGLMNMGEVAGQIYDKTEKVPDADLRRMSSTYDGYRSMLSEREARQQYMKDVAGAAPAAAFLISYALGGIEGKVGERLGGAGPIGFKRGLVEGAKAEGKQEFAESAGGEALTQEQLYQQMFIPKNWQKVLSQGLEGATIGSIIGGGVGGATNIGGVRTAPVIGPDETQQSALTSEVTPPAGTTPPPTGAVTPEPDTTPENTGTLLAQQEKVLSGEVPAMYFPVGTQELALPPDLERIERPEGGVMHFDPGALSPQTALEVPLNQLLGYVEPKADVLKAAAQGVPTKVVAELNPQGEEVRAAIVTAPRAGEQAGLFEETASPGNVVQEVSPQQIQQGRGLELSRLEQRDQETRQGFRDFEAGTPVYPTPGATGARAARAPLPSTATLPPTPTDRVAYEDEYAQYQAEQRVAQAAVAQEQQATADAARRARMEAGLTKAEQAIATARVRAAEKPKSKARATKEEVAARKAEREAAARAKAEQKAAKKAEREAAKARAAEEKAARDTEEKAARDAATKAEPDKLARVSTFMVRQAARLAAAAAAKRTRGVGTGKGGKGKAALQAKQRAAARNAFESNVPGLDEVFTEKPDTSPQMSLELRPRRKQEPTIFVQSPEQVAALRARLERLVAQVEAVAVLPDSIREGQSDYVMFAKHAKDALANYIGKTTKGALEKTNQFVVDELAARQGDFGAMRDRRLEEGNQAKQLNASIEGLAEVQKPNTDSGARVLERVSTPDAQTLSEMAEEGTVADRFEAALERLREMLAEGSGLTEQNLQELSQIAGRDLTDIKTFNTIMSGDLEAQMPSRDAPARSASAVKREDARIAAALRELYNALNAPTEETARIAARARRDAMAEQVERAAPGVMTSIAGDVVVLGSQTNAPGTAAKPVYSMSVNKAISRILEDSKQTAARGPLFKRFASLIRQQAGGVPVHVMSDADMDKLGYSFADGIFQPVDDVIIIRQSVFEGSYATVSHVLLHEAAHAALISRTLNDPLAIGQIQAIAAEVRALLGGDTDLYAFSNVQEFIAEAFSNPGLQKLLMRTPISADLAAKLDLPGWRGRSMWWGVLGKFANWIGWSKFNNEAFTAMHAITSVGERLADNRPPMFVPGWEKLFGISYSSRADREALSPFWQQESAAKSALSNLPLTSKVRKDALLNKVTDNAAATSSWLSKVAILGSTLDQLRQQYNGLFVAKDGVDILGRVVENMQRQAPYARTKKETADALAQEFLTYARNNRVEAAVLVDLMMDATMSNVQLGPNANNAHLNAGWRGIQGKQNLPRLQKAYDNDIGPEARALYQKMVTYYRDTQNEMTRGVIGNVLDELKIAPPNRDAFITRVMNGAMTPADEKLFEDKPTALKAFKDANEMRVIQGDYFPLMRQGDYVVVTTDDIKDLMGGKEIAPGKVEFRGRTRSEAMRMANNFIANSELRIIDRRSAPENSVQNDFGVIVSVQKNGVFFFESEKEALQWQREHAGEYDKVSPVQPKRDTGLESKDLTVAQFNTLMGAINRQPGVEDSTRDVMRNVMEQAAARMMSGNRVQQRRIARRNVLGASKDFARNLALYGQSTSGYLAKLRYMPAIRDDLKAMNEISRDYMDKDAPQRIRLLNELNKRIDDNEAGKNEPPLWMRDLMTATYLGKLFSPMYSVVNGMQPWMMTFPMLAGRYGSWRARGALTGAYDAIGFSSRVMDGIVNSVQAGKNFNAIAFDTRDVVGSIKKNLAKEPDGAELVKLIDNLLERGAMSSAGFELSQSIAEGRGRLGTAFSNVDRVSRQLPQAIEDINRAVTAIATYRLAMQAKKGVDKSLAEAFTTVMNTQGDYSGGNAPRFFNNPVLRPALQFKKYAQMATYLLVDAAYRSFDGKISAEERVIARKQLLNVFSMQIAMAGMLSLPGIEIAKLAFMIAAFFGAGDGWDEQEERLRKLADDTLGKTWGELVSRGVLSRALNIDLSKRLSLADMWTFGEPKKYDKEGSAAYLFNLAFGAPGGTILDAAGGVSDVVKGEWATGTAKIVPIKIIADTLRASNNYSEGKVTNTELAMNIFGVRSGRQAEKTEEIGSSIRKMQDIERSYKDLSRQYIRAKTAGEQAIMRAKIVEHNKTAPLRYKVFPNALDKRRAKNEEERVN
jgi:hypothetical protein